MWRTSPSRDNVDVDQFDTAHHDPAQVDAAEPGARHIDGEEFRTAEVNALEPGATKINTHEVSHAMTLTV